MAPPRSRQAPPERRYLSVEAAATYADVSTQSIRRYIDTGQLPAYRLGKRLIKVQQADLDGLFRRIPAVGQ